ncbi:hypothetical protein EJB05_03479, partial [Eragrostis curvula]
MHCFTIGSILSATTGDMEHQLHASILPHLQAEPRVLDRLVSKHKNCTPAANSDFQYLKVQPTSRLKMYCYICAF